MVLLILPLKNPSLRDPNPCRHLQRHDPQQLASTCARRIQVRNVSGVPIPNMPATAVIAAHCDRYCGRTSATMRTARSRSSSGYLLTRPITQILPRSEVSRNAGTA